MSEIITKALPGFMELLPEEQIEFDKIKATIEETFQQFGFTPLDTPAIERSKVLFAKAGGETEKQIYSVKNSRGGAEQEDGSISELSLRFDLTVPLARYVAEHFNDLSFPFRRYHISKVYRGERPQKGRFREFYQCDIDVIGKDKLSVRYDAEIPTIIYQLFKKLDFGKFTIRINNRKLLNGLIHSLEEEVEYAEILRVIDKVEKVDEADFMMMLEERGLGKKSVDILLQFIQITGSVDEVLARLRGLGIDNERFNEGLSELEEVARLISLMGVDPDYFAIDLSIARGLDYYTGTVYETILDDNPKLGSVCSGGRFDNLASYYTDEKLPGVGISIGLTRLFYQLQQIGLIECSQKTTADIVVVPMDGGNMPYALDVAGKLRGQGFNVDILMEDSTVKKKFQYVKRKNARFNIIVGSDEVDAGEVTLQYKKDDAVISNRRTLDDAVKEMRGE